MMGSFKPMVKMETTEPSVILKLKKGGHVNMKKGGKAEGGYKKMADGGGALAALAGTPALIGRPAVNAMVRAPGKPSMGARRMAMIAKKPAMPPAPMAESMSAPVMKKGGKTGMAEGGMSDAKQDKAMIKKAFKQHDSQEHKGDKGTSLKLKRGGKMATGGVTMGNAGGFKTGGTVTGNEGEYLESKMVTAGKKGMAKGGMPMKNGKPAFLSKGMKAGGMSCATGGVTYGQGGFKMGGKTTKKAYATGGTVNSGRPVAMPQGQKKPTKPVEINHFAGTYKKGGNVKMGGGGSASDKEVDMSKGAYDNAAKHSRELEDAMNPLGMIKELYGKARDAFKPKGEGAVTKTEKSITVQPAKKSGGSVRC